MAGAASALDLPLPPDLSLVDERGRKLLLGPDPAQAEAGRLQRDLDLQAAINCYITEHNHSPTPSVWTQPAAAILASVNGVAASSE